MINLSIFRITLVKLESIRLLKKRELYFFWTQAVTRKIISWFRRTMLCSMRRKKGGKKAYMEENKENRYSYNKLWLHR